MIVEYTRLDAWLSFRIKANNGVDPVQIEVPMPNQRSRFRKMLKRNGFHYNVNGDVTEISNKKHYARI